MHINSPAFSSPASVQRSSIPRPSAWRVVGVQMGLTQSIALGLLMIGQTSAAMSASVGGWIAVIPNALFVLWAFRHAGAQAAKSIASDFYIGETLKMLATVAGFVFAFQLLSPLHVGWLFGAYVAGLSVYWIAPWILSAGSAR